MKIALLTKYDDLAASTRLRFGQYQTHLEAAGFEVEARPLLSNDYLERLYAGQQRDVQEIIGRYCQRLFWLCSRPDVDIIWLHCEAFPWMPSFFERAVRWCGKPVIFDYDDAIFHNYDAHRNPFVRRLLGNRLRATIGGAQVVFAGNQYLADYAGSFCNRVEIVPTVLDVSLYTPSVAAREGRAGLSVGWLGTPTTWAEYMHDLLPVICPVIEGQGATLEAMGAGRHAQSSASMRISEWSEEQEIPFLQNLSIGIMPLHDTPFARGKCGFKLIQYMACGLPVIASPVGVNSDIVEHGVNGFLASTEREWAAALETLLGDPELRARMGAAGRKKVVEHYSSEVWAPRVTRIVQSLVS